MEISDAEYAKLLVETEAFQYANAVRNLMEQKKRVEMDLKVDAWIKYRDGLPKDLRVHAVKTYRNSFK